MGLAQSHDTSSNGSFEKAIEYPQMYHKTLNNLATTYFRLGKYQKAEVRFLESIQASPDQAMTFNNIGNLFTPAEVHIISISSGPFIYSGQTIPKFLGVDKKASKTSRLNEARTIINVPDYIIVPPFDSLLVPFFIWLHCPLVSFFS